MVVKIEGCISLTSLQLPVVFLHMIQFRVCCGMLGHVPIFFLHAISALIFILSLLAPVITSFFNLKHVNFKTTGELPPPCQQ